MPSLAQIRRKIKVETRITSCEPMGAHTTFGIGGPADLYCRPQSVEEAKHIWSVCRSEGASVFVLGAGANILVSDMGIRGMVMDMGGLRAMEAHGRKLTADAGAAVNDVSQIAADSGLSGLEFIFSMPGSVGGSAWMNARCYGRSMSEVLEYVELLTRDSSGRVAEERFPVDAAVFDYKQSPFQSMDCLILRAGFALQPGDRDESTAQMQAHRTDRASKGHFDHPSAGSAFKNDHAFGSPTGKIVDSLGLRGYASGGAAISPAHANIVVNTGDATARDVVDVLKHVEGAVFERLGFRLEREILLVGEWE